MTTTRVSASVTLHRKPKDGKDGYLAQVVPSLINIVTDSQGMPVFTEHAHIELEQPEEYPFVESETKKVDEETYPGYVTMRSSNQDIDKSESRVRLWFSHMEKLTLVYSSNAESRYDYIMLSNLDTELPEGTTVGAAQNPLVKVHTKGNQTSGITNEVTYEGMDAMKKHFIDVVFVKDTNGKSGDDCGYVAFPSDEKLPLVLYRDYVLEPKMQNATGEVTFDYTDTEETKAEEKAVLPDKCGLTYIKPEGNKTLTVRIQKKQMVKGTELVLRVKDSGNGGVHLVRVPVSVTSNGMPSRMLTATPDTVYVPCDEFGKALEITSAEIDLSIMTAGVAERGKSSGYEIRTSGCAKGALTVSDGIVWVEKDANMMASNDNSVTFFMTLKDGNYVSATVHMVAQVRGTKGNPGYDGCLIRQTEWEEGLTYHNDSSLTPEQCLELYGTTTRYLDEVTVSEYDGGNGEKYLCKVTHTSSTGNKPVETGSSTEWEKVNKVKSPTYIPFADITRAVVEYLQAKQIVIKDPASSQPYAAFGAATADNPYPLWLGAAEPENAPFWVNANGEVHTTMIRRQMEFWDFVIDDENYFASYYLKKYCPSYIRASVGYRDDTRERTKVDISKGWTMLHKQTPQVYIVLPYAGHVQGKEVEIVVPNCFYNAAKRGVIAITALSGQGHTPVVLTENVYKNYKPFDPAKSATVTNGVEPGYEGLDFSVPEGTDGYMMTINGNWRSMILMDCLDEAWLNREYQDKNNLPEQDIYDRTSYVRLYASQITLMGKKYPCWYIVESRNVKLIGDSGSEPIG